MSIRSTFDEKISLVNAIKFKKNSLYTTKRGVDGKILAYLLLATLLFYF